MECWAPANVSFAYGKSSTDLLNRPFHIHIIFSSRKMQQDGRKIDMAAVEIVTQDNRKFAPSSPPLVAE